MTTVLFVAIFLLCVAVGVFFYLRGGPDGGRDPGLEQDAARLARLDARMEKNGSWDKAEAKFQARQRAKGELPPTHEQG